MEVKMARSLGIIVIVSLLTFVSVVHAGDTGHGQSVREVSDELDKVTRMIPGGFYCKCLRRRVQFRGICQACITKKKKRGTRKPRGPRVWCKCLKRLVWSQKQCRCPSPTPSTSPSPSPSYSPKPITALVLPGNQTLIIDGPVNEPLEAQQFQFAGVFCRCLGRRTRYKNECCHCSVRKCKCWNRWWKNRRRYGRYRNFRSCGTRCRRCGYKR